MKARIRKIGVWVEETHIEGGKSISPPTRKAVAAAVIENPHAGQFVEDLSDLMEVGAELGGLLGEKAVAALGIARSEAESYGKAAMVGENGELEHAAALLHPKMGAPLRVAVEKVRRWCRPRKRGADWGKTLISRWATRTRPMCGRILMGLRSGSMTRPGPMRS